MTRHATHLHLSWRVTVLLFAAACSSGDAGRPDDESKADRRNRVRIGTFNVHQLFDTQCDSDNCGPDDFESVVSEDELQKHVHELADAILRLGADVVALQEIENEASLEALRDALGDAMPYSVIGEAGFAASMDVAVVSRQPIEDVIGHRDDEVLVRPDGTETEFSRELLEVHTTARTGLPVVVFAAHFKAKTKDDPGRRLAEAETAARLVNETADAHPDAVVVLAGDLNDTPGSPALDAMTGDGGLIRVADDLTKGAQITYRFMNRGEAIDHILLAPTRDDARISRSTKSWRDAGGGFGGSDHFALTSDFDASTR